MPFEGGKYEFKNIELKTEYGTLTIPRNKINKIDVMYYDASEAAGMKTFKLFASTHISSNQNGGWLKTGIMVKSGQHINISASGEVTLASLSNGKYNPNGAVSSSYEDEYGYESTSTYPTYGNVVYKVGETGTTIKAGSNYKGMVVNGGMLYLSIYETVYNASNTGFYVVKLNTK